MNYSQQIRLNKFGQGLVDLESMLTDFKTLESNEQQKILIELLFFLKQSKPLDTYIEAAILSSGLKPTYTPCVLLRNGVSYSNLKRITELPINEYNKIFTLLLSLFKIAYANRFEEEKNNPNKWWYWDLTQPEIEEQIRIKFIK